MCNHGVTLDTKHRAKSAEAFYRLTRVGERMNEIKTAIDAMNIGDKIMYYRGVTSGYYKDDPTNATALKRYFKNLQCRENHVFTQVLEGKDRLNGNNIFQYWIKRLR